MQAIDRFLLLGICLSLISCVLDNPVDETESPTEFEYNAWLLERLYLYPSELPNAFATADTSVALLYKSLSDPYTRYVAKAHSEETITNINTSYVPGDIGVELLLASGNKHPLFIYRIYSKGPAGRAGIPRYANILSINGVDLEGDSAYIRYQNTLSKNKEIVLTVTSRGDTLSPYSLTKESIYAPTVFVDTLDGFIFISIREFTLTTEDPVDGTLGELRKALDATRKADVRIIDVRNNPGGHMSQCIGAADLFVKSGILSTRVDKYFDGNGAATTKRLDYRASSGDLAESGKFVLLANRNTASCGEIFVAAIAENTDIPLLGETTYGKGIGQSSWKTIDGGLAIITNLQLYTPQGTSYHGIGIAPDVQCGDDFTLCAIEKAQSLTNTVVEKKRLNNIPYSLEKQTFYLPRKPWGGAIP